LIIVQNVNWFDLSQHITAKKHTQYQQIESENTKEVLRDGASESMQEDTVETVTDGVGIATDYIARDIAKLRRQIACLLTQ